MPIRHSRTACAVALTLAVQLAIAATEDEATVVVTATRQPARIDSLLSDITLIERKEIELAGAATLPELLSRQPGLQISTRGGSAASLYLRGNSDKHTLLLVDGVRLGSSTIGSPDLAMMPLADIERIEILRGPASALYGSDAIGGVIHVITRKGKGPASFRGEIGAGSRGTSRIGGSVSGSDERWSYALSGGQERSHGFNSVTNPRADAYNADDDGYRTDRISGRLEFKLAPGQVIGGSILHTASQTDMDYADLWSLPAIRANFDHRTKTANQVDSLYLRNRLSEAWTSTLRFGNGRNDYHHRKSLTATDRFATEQRQLTWQNDVSLPLGEFLLVAEQNEEQVTSTTAYTDASRRVSSYLAGWHATAGVHRWQASIRRDDNSQFGGKTTGALGYGLQLASNWRLSGSLGTAYKAPTFNDLYWPGAGNPGLKPEESKNRELSLSFEEGKLRSSATLYRNDLDSLIEWAPAGGGLWLPGNVAQARIQGLTLAAENTWGAWQGKASFDWLDARNTDTGRFMRYRSKASSQASLRYSGPGWRAGGELSLYGHRYDDTANDVRLGGYGLFNLFAEYALDRQLTLFARADNVFDKHYMLVKDTTAWAAPSDFGVPGRMLFVGIRYSLR